MIHVGTSGYSYDDWEGPFYPPGLPKGNRLQFYAAHFKATEINSTFYRILPPSAMAAMLRKVPSDFIFTVKLNRALTHEPGPDTEAAFNDFRESLKPLLDAGQLGCVLAQFPYSFHNNEANRRRLSELAERLGDLPTVVEFRNDEWLAEPVLDFLRQQNLGFVCVDQPRLEGLIPPIVVATSAIGYLRFHGRNYAKWWRHQEAYERYDYLYSEDELREWLPKLCDLAHRTEHTYVFFNNHYMAQAVANAQQLLDLLAAEARRPPRKRRHNGRPTHNPIPTGEGIWGPPWWAGRIGRNAGHTPRGCCHPLAWPEGPGKVPARQRPAVSPGYS